jgi:hypothetical protein
MRLSINAEANPVLSVAWRFRVVHRLLRPTALPLEPGVTKELRSH